MKKLALIVTFTAALTFAASARVLETQQQALASVFTGGSTMVRQSFFLPADKLEQARKEAGLDIREALVIRYTGSNGMYAYFDSHRVRTEAETVMIVIDANGAISRIEILSFNEPTDYFPKRRWLDQFLGRHLDKDLSLKGAIRPMSGASLTGTAIVTSARKILAIHHVLGK